MYSVLYQICHPGKMRYKFKLVKLCKHPGTLTYIVQFNERIGCIRQINLEFVLQKYVHFQPTKVLPTALQQGTSF